MLLLERRFFSRVIFTEQQTRIMHISTAPTIMINKPTAAVNIISLRVSNSSELEVGVDVGELVLEPTGRSSSVENSIRVKFSNTSCMFE